MAYKITDDCINCGVCAVECTFSAVYPAGYNWRNSCALRYVYSPDVPVIIDSFYSSKHYYIVPGKCTECKTKNDEPMCILVCPTGGVIKDAVFNTFNKELFCSSIRNFNLN